MKIEKGAKSWPNHDLTTTRLRGFWDIAPKHPIHRLASFIYHERSAYQPCFWALAVILMHVRPLIHAAEFHSHDEAFYR